MPDARPYDGGAPSAVQSVDGSWRDDGRYIVININGQEMKLLKTTTEPAQNGQSALAAFDDHLVPIAQPPQPNDPTDNGILLLPPTGLETIRGESIQGEASPAIGLPAQGRVQGRMLQRGHPLANCYVVIAPWPRGDQADSSVDTREPLSTITNDEGFYLFEHVPPREYKLTWLPNGAKQWIRRIAMRPDVIVHEGQDVTLKDIRMALQTIN
jgi:hypothetical protein